MSAPIKLVTVNTNPERAKRLIGRMVEALKDRYTIDYVDNTTEIAGVEEVVKKNQPDILFSASMWTEEQATEIHSIAKTTKPGLSTYALPHGYQVEHGPDAVVELLLEKVPALIEANGLGKSKL